MRLFGYDLTVRKSAQAQLPPGINLNSVWSAYSPWYPTIQESFAGAWQQNVDVRLEDTLQYWPVYRCIAIISSDIAKLRIKLVQENPDEDGIWEEVESPAFSPLLRKPNPYQTRIQFMQHWLESKLARGNAYILLQRDNRNTVRAMYVLDPTRVRVLVSDDTQVFYQLTRDNMAELEENVIVVPASEIIHDRYATPYHPLVGVSPLYAAGLNALGGLNIQKNSTLFFGNASRPGGILTAPGAISDETAKRLKDVWETNYSGLNVGKIAVLGDGLTFGQVAVSAEDAQLIEQLKWSATTICGVYGVPSYMLNISPTPTHTNIESLTVQYYAQCLQVLIKAAQLCLVEGLALPSQYGVHFDLDELLQMDTSSRFDILQKAKGTLTLNESRRRVNVKKVSGGDTIYLQDQDHSLAAIEARDKQIIDQANNPPQIAPPQLAPPATADGIPPAGAGNGQTTSNQQRRALIEGAKRQILRYGRRAA